MKENSARIAYSLLTLLTTEEKKEFLTARKRTNGTQQVLDYLIANPHLGMESHIQFHKSSYGSIRVQMSNIVKDLEVYIAQIGSSDDKFRRWIFLLQRIRKSTNPELFNRFYKKADKWLSKQPKRGIKYFRTKYELITERQSYFGRTTLERIELSRKLNEYHSIYIRLEALRLELVNLDLKLLTSGQFQYRALEESVINTLTEIEEDFDSKNSDENAIIKLYLLFYNLLKYGKGNTQELIEILNEKYRNAEQDKIAEFYLFILNHLIRKTWTDKTKENNEAFFSLIPKGIELGIYLTDGYLRANILFIFIKASGLIGRIEEIEKLIPQYISLLEESDKQTSINYIKLLVLYFKGEYKRLIEKADGFVVGEKKSVLRLNFDFLVCQSLYLDGEIESLEKKLRNIDLWMKRNNLVNKKHKKIFIERLALFKKMIAIEGFDGKKEFRQVLEQSPLPFNHRVFFEQMLRESL